MSGLPSQFVGQPQTHKNKTEARRFAEPAPLKERSVLFVGLAKACFREVKKSMWTTGKSVNSSVSVVFGEMTTTYRDRCLVTPNPSILKSH